MVAEYDYDLIAIGSGPTGQRAVIQTAKLEKKVAIVEKRHSFGGICVDIDASIISIFCARFPHLKGRFEILKSNFDAGVDIGIIPDDRGAKKEDFFCPNQTNPFFSPCP